MTRILLYNIKGEKEMKIRLAAYRLGLTCVSVAPSDFGRPLGLLLGLPGYAPGGEAAEDFPDEMLVMEELSSELLDAMRAMGVSVALKAVVTESNRAWSAAALCAELKKEHEAMRRAAPKKQQNRHPRKK